MLPLTPHTRQIVLICGFVVRSPDISRVFRFSQEIGGKPKDLPHIVKSEYSNPSIRSLTSKFFLTFWAVAGDKAKIFEEMLLKAIFFN